MKKIICSLILILFVLLCFADILTSRAIRSVVPIIDELGNKIATGVLFKSSGNIFLITNKHVTDNRDITCILCYKLIDDYIITNPLVIGTTSAITLNDNIDLSCVKLNNKTKFEIEESNYLIPIDICMLMTDSIVNSEFYGPGDDILIIGFPVNPQLKFLYSDEKVFNFFPIVRRGIISSTSDEKTHSFLLNAEILGGNSGSLIITKHSNSRLTPTGIHMEAKFYIYGIAAASMFIGKENTGISKAFNYNAIRLLIEKADEIKFD